jgi:hypothetical protein
MEMSAAEVIFASTGAETLVLPGEALRTLGDRCVNTSLSETLFF